MISDDDIVTTASVAAVSPPADPIADIQEQLNVLADSVDTFARTVSAAIEKIGIDIQAIAPQGSEDQ